MTSADTTIAAPQAYEIEAEIRIDARPAVVWRALTDEVGKWWPHTFVDEPVAIRLEPTIGGRFYEQFDDTGAGALYATVTYVQPERVLRISGPMGMSGAAVYVKTYRLEPVDGGTVVRTTAATLGAVTADTRENYRSGGDEVLRSLKTFAESSVQ
jgi:uncharacterized protein YndB with AHSA1/START domain